MNVMCADGHTGRFGIKTMIKLNPSWTCPYCHKIWKHEDVEIAEEHLLTIHSDKVERINGTWQIKDSEEIQSLAP